MAEVTNLDALVPEDIQFDYRGKSYTVPGDVPTREVFKLVRLFNDLSDDGQLEDQEKAIASVEQALLGLFQISDPKLTVLPFGAMGLRAVLLTLLSKFGFEVTDGADVRPPAPKKTRKAPRK